MHVTFPLVSDPGNIKYFSPPSYSPLLSSTTPSTTNSKSSLSRLNYRLHAQHLSDSRLLISTMPRRKAPPSTKTRPNSSTIIYICIYIFWALAVSFLAAATTLLITPPLTPSKAGWCMLFALPASIVVSRICLRALDNCMQNDEGQGKRDKKAVKGSKQMHKRKKQERRKY